MRDINIIFIEDRKFDKPLYWDELVKFEGKEYRVVGTGFIPNFKDESGDFRFWTLKSDNGRIFVEKTPEEIVRCLEDK